MISERGVQRVQRGSRTRFLTRIFLLAAIAGGAWTDMPISSEGPSFLVPVTNVTVPVGREAVLACVVENLSVFKVAWLRVDTQTILTIANHVITKNNRIVVTHVEHKTWHLHIRNVKETDRGAYMCQINTDPMKSQTGYLEVVVPPDISDYATSTDMVVREGSNVTLSCKATGCPTPNITWKREDGKLIIVGKNKEEIVRGPIFNITKATRMHMGAYLCIASNGVPPSVSKRIMLTIHFPPMIEIQHQSVYAEEGDQVTLECSSEAFPKSINYWMKGNNEIIQKEDKYEISTFLHNNTYNVRMKLTIRSVAISDYGSYKCISKNSLGERDGNITLYQIVTTTQPSTTSTTMLPTVEKVENVQKSRQRPVPSLEPSSNEITDSSLPTAVRNGDLRFRDRPSSGGYSDAENAIATEGRKSIDSEIRPRRIDNTAQSMSSRGTSTNFLAQSRAAICIILLSALS